MAERAASGGGAVPFALTRRHLLQLIGVAGGATGLYGALRALDLLPGSSAGADLACDSPCGGGAGRRIVILGAGLAGMTAAYELGKLGYECQILEARQRAGGRCWTVRRGTVETEVGGSRQECAFDDGLYKDIPSDLPASVQGAMRQVEYVAAMKVGLQFARRFWEDDEAIYGGITWTNLPIRNIWYPSSGYHARKGVLVGMYAFGDDAVTIGRLGLPERTERALAEGERIHPQYRREFETAFSVAWNRIAHNQGCYAIYSPATRGNAYPLLQQSDGRIYLAGEHLSYLTGWQEGAILSAQSVVARIRQQAMVSAPA